MEEIMIDDEILNSIAACGLNCEKCFAYEGGYIRRYSLKLKEKLGNFDVYAKRFVTLLGNPIFKKYSDFKLMLDYFSSENCKGCRNENCKLFMSCGVKDCHQKNNLDFCFQCNDFPCSRTNFDKSLQKRWIQNNERIREIGIEAFYAEIKDKPRY